MKLLSSRMAHAEHRLVEEQLALEAELRAAENDKSTTSARQRNGATQASRASRAPSIER